MSAETIAVVYCVALTIVLAAPLAILAGWCPLCVDRADLPIPVYNGTQTQGPVMIHNNGTLQRCNLIYNLPSGKVFGECVEIHAKL